jgi:hypothetical protein
MSSGVQQKRLKGNALSHRLLRSNENLLASYKRNYISEFLSRQGINTIDKRAFPLR